MLRRAEPIEVVGERVVERERGESLVGLDSSAAIYTRLGLQGEGKSESETATKREVVTKEARGVRKTGWKRK